MLQQNKYPTIAYDNAVGIQNLQGNQEIGELELIFAIGTPIQINKLDTTRIQEKRDGMNKQIQQLQNERSMNQQLTPEKRQPMQQSQQAPYQNQLDNNFNDQKIDMNVQQQTQQQYMTPSELFTFILEKIRRSSNQILPKLKEFILRLEQTGRKLSKTQFMSFLEDLQLPEITQQRTYNLTEIIDYKHNGEIDGAEFMESYNNYYELEELLRNDYISIIKDLKALLVSSRIQLSDFENFLNKETQFGYLRTSKFKQSLQMINFVPALSSALVEKIVNMMDVNGDGYIFITDLVDYLRKLEVYENLAYIKYPKLTFYNTICKKIFSQLIENQYTIDKLFRNMAIQIPRMGIEHVKNIFYLADVDISIWEALVLIEQINTINKEGMGKGKMEVSFEHFEEFCEKYFMEFSKGKNMKQSQSKSPNKSQNLQNLKNQKESGVTLTESVNDIANLLNQKSSIKQQNQEENEKEIQLAALQKQGEKQFAELQHQFQLPNQHEVKSSPASPTKQNQELLPEINTFLHEMKRSPSTGKLTLEQKKLQIESDDKFLAENKNQNLTYMLQLQQRESAHKEREAQQFTVIQQQQSKLDEQSRIIQQWEQTVAERNERKAKEFTVENCPQIRHAFAIEANGIQQFSIDDKLEGKVLSLRYLFPKSESLIESSQFVGEQKKYEYQLNMAAKHKFLLDRNIDILQHLIKDNKDGLLIQMVKKGEVLDQSLGHCILPWDDFISLCSSVDSQYPQTQKISTTSTKAYFLYPVSNSSKPTLCKLPLTLTYTRKYIPLPQDNPMAQLPIFSSSTTVKRFLPKVSSVFVTVQRVQIDLNYCNEEEFETQCSVSLFNELSQVVTDIVKNRNDYYPKYNGHWDFELTERAIEEFKTQSAVVKLIKNSVHVATGTIKLLPLLVSDRPITCEVELFGLNNSQRMALVTVILGLQSQGISDDINVNKFERETQYGVLFIKLLEIFCLDYIQQPRNVYFSVKQGQIGPLIKQESSPSEITVLDGTEFWVNLTELTPKIPLEISLFEKSLTGGQDEILGYININAQSILDSAQNQNKKITVNSCYWHLVGTKKQTRSRVGGKIVLWLVQEKNEIPKIEKLGHVFGRKDIKQEQLQPIDQYLQYNCKLTCGAVELLEKYVNKLNKQEIFELFSAQICQNLTATGLEDSQLTYDNYKQEFGFYDEKNQGYVDLEVVEKIFKQYGITLEGLQKEVLLKFVCKNLCQQMTDSTIKIFHNEEKFDYQLFLRKLIPEEYFSFSKKKNLDQIYENSDRINNFYGTKTDNNNVFEAAQKQEIERNFNIEIVIEMAKNLHILNKGLPPNCLVKCENFQNFETQFQIREANPLFNYQNSIILNSKMIQDNLQLSFTIYHRSYNINYQESISSLSVIGRAVISIEELFQRCKQQQAFQQVSQTFTVQIMNKNMEQEQVGSVTARNNPILKVQVQMEISEKNSFIPSQQNNQEIQQQQSTQQKYLIQTPKSKQQQQISQQQRYSSSDKKYNYNPLQMQIATVPNQFQPQIQDRQQSVGDQFHDELTFGMKFLLQNFVKDIVENFNKTMEEIYKQTDDQINNLNQQIKSAQMEKTINELDQIQDKFNHSDQVPPKTLQNENQNMLNYSPHIPKDFDKTINEKKRQNYHQNEEKPPISSKPSARLSSYKRLRQIEDKLKFSIKDNNELKRIAGIMKQQDLGDKQKYFDISSDSDA